MGAGVEFRLLGSVEMWQAGRPVATGAPRQRTVLAALLVDAGRVVPPDVLIDRVWGEAAPRDARGTLNAYLSRIRAALRDGEPDAGREADRLIHRAGGYVLAVEPGRVDVLRLRQLVNEADDPGCGDDRRVTVLREAVALWHGEPLGGLSGAWVERTRRAWRQQHLDLVVAWAQAELRTGNPTAVIGPLIELADEHPLAESVAAALMQALGAAGRTADALELYATMRRRLADELGTDPGTELQAMHRRLLRGQSPASVNPPGQMAVNERTAPRQLPAAVPDFVGRTAELSVLTDLLAGAGSSAGAVTVAAIAGMAGVGKTALAVHWAHRVADRFPDGQLYINLRGFAPAAEVVDPADAIRAFLDALGVVPQRIPSGMAAQTALYRSLIAGRRMLVVLDNARDTAQVRPLLPGSAGCLVVVTSRNLLTGLIADGAGPVGLDLLSAGDAWRLLADRIGGGRLTTEPEAAAAIIDRCGRLPLALSLVAARASRRAARPVVHRSSQLRHERSPADRHRLAIRHRNPLRHIWWRPRSRPPPSIDT